MEDAPIQKTVMIPKPPETLFEQFTTELSAWWPRARDHLGESKMQAMNIEKEEGGRVYERLKDGSTLRWGTVEIWEPPRRLRLSFHPEVEESEGQVVDVVFEERGDETRVTLTHSGWKTLGPEAPASRDDLETGWEPVLGRLASEV